MKTKRKTRNQTPPTTRMEQEFLNTALSKVRSPESRYWLTMAFDAAASTLSLMENNGGMLAATDAKPARKSAR